MWAWVAIVAKLHRKAGDGSAMERAVLWFLFWPLLLAWSFVRPSAGADDLTYRKPNRPQIS
jgi:hypothetical protein